MTRKKVTLYTDGSCNPNPGPGGYAFVIVENDKIVNSICAFKERTTNNEMELMAIEQGIDYCKTHNYQITKIYTDSRYCKYCITRWAGTWLRNNWKTMGGSQVKNKEIIEKLHRLWLEYQFEIIWVKGHNGNRFNEQADHLCRGLVIRHYEKISETFDDISKMYFGIHKGTKMISVPAEYLLNLYTNIDKNNPYYTPVITYIEENKKLIEEELEKENNSYI